MFFGCFTYAEPNKLLGMNLFYQVVISLYYLFYRNGDSEINKRGKQIVTSPWWAIFGPGPVILKEDKIQKDILPGIGLYSIYIVWNYTNTS